MNLKIKFDHMIIFLSRQFGAGIGTLLLIVMISVMFMVYRNKLHTLPEDQNSEKNGAAIKTIALFITAVMICISLFQVINIQDGENRRWFALTMIITRTRGTLLLDRGSKGGRAGGGSSLSSEVPPLWQIYYLVLYTMFNVV